MQIVLREGLPFVTATLTHGGKSVEIADVLVDTGAASTVINADVAGEIGIAASRTDRLRKLRGVGGHEFVFVRQIDRVAVGDRGLDHFEIEIGEMDYGMEIAGIVGMDFLLASGAVINLRALRLEFPVERSTRP